MRSLGYAVILGIVGLGADCASVRAAQPTEYRLIIQSHLFSPAVLDVPAGIKIRLIVENRDASAEEFESYDLNREKIVAGKSSIVVFIGPLKAGSYKYFGDFNQDSANGRIVAK